MAAVLDIPTGNRMKLIHQMPSAHQALFLIWRGMHKQRFCITQQQVDIYFFFID